MARPSESQAVAWGRARAASLRAGHVGIPAGPLPPGELLRTPAASAVGTLAASHGLGCFHFEHRVHLPLPLAWVPAGQPELADPPVWEGGVLPEAKYQSFRHDLSMGSYHPHHRAKWSTHELCHGLVGFAWRPGASDLFHATAGRLAELLPVALWYFFDEAWLRRCPDHEGDGALFRTHCPRCEAVAGPRPDDPDAATRIADGLRFVDRELAAVARTRREGRPVPHRWATLDLTSDGLAYARAHRDRLADADFASWVERFHVEGEGWHPSLEALEARVEAVLGGLLGGDLPAPAAAPETLRLRATVQDVASRLLQVAGSLDGARARGVRGVVDGLTPVRGDADRGPAEAALRATAEAYAALAAVEDGLPLADDVFALGYAAPGAVPGVGPLLDGVASGMPLLTEAAEERLEALVEAFAPGDLGRWSRRPLAVRLAEHLAASGGAVADLARWEAALATLPRVAAPPLRGPARDARRALAEHARVVQLDHDVIALAEAIDRGGVSAAEVDGRWALVDEEGASPAPEPTALVVAREPDGEITLLDVDPATGAELAALGEGGVPALPEDEQAELASFGVLVPVAWRL